MVCLNLFSYYFCVILNVVKCADHVIDLGPEGGDRGGNLVAAGAPEEVAQCAESYTGQFLKEKLGNS